MPISFMVTNSRLEQVSVVWRTLSPCFLERLGSARIPHRMMLVLNVERAIRNELIL